MVWLNDKRRLALFPAGTIVRDPSLTILNLWHVASRTWICAKPEFRLCWMKLCSSDTHYATVLWSIVRKSAWLCVDWWVSYKAEKIEEGLLTNVMLWRINDQFIKWYFHCKIEVILCQEGEKQEILCFFCKAVQ